MYGSSALRRLLHVREIKEEQNRLVLQTATAEVRALENALARSQLRKRQGRTLIIDSAKTGVLTDRMVGVEECCAAVREAELASTRMTDAKERVTESLEAYLATRVERRQAEKLVEETETQVALVVARRNQQWLDDWFRSRLSSRKPSHS